MGGQHSRKCFRILFNLVIEDSANFVQLLKVPNFCLLLVRASYRRNCRSTTIAPMLCGFYRVALQTCASSELGFLVPVQMKIDLFDLQRLVGDSEGNSCNRGLILSAILNELTNEFESDGIDDDK